MSGLEDEQPQLPLAGAGQRLAAAREAAGLSRAAIAQRTRISERLIAKIEAGDFAGLPSRAYATGFTRSLARAVGLDEDEMVEAVRREMGFSALAQADDASSFEPGDPARVPSARFAWWLAFAALLATVAGGLFIWRTYYAPSVVLPSILPEETPTAEAVVTSPAILPLATGSFDAAASMAPDPALTAAPQPRPRARTTHRTGAGGSTASPTGEAPSPQPSTDSN